MITPGQRDWIDYAALTLAIVVGLGSSLQSWVVWNSQSQFREAFLFSTTANACAEFSASVRNRLNAFAEIAVYSDAFRTPVAALDDVPSVHNFREAGRMMDVALARLELVAAEELIEQATTITSRLEDTRIQWIGLRAPLRRTDGVELVQGMSVAMMEFRDECRERTNAD